MAKTKPKTIRISPDARDKVICDFYPRQIEEGFVDRESLNNMEMRLHAGALCLYATTLMTKIYETSPEKIKFDARERKIELTEMIKKDSRFTHLTDDQVAEKVDDIIIRDIRNCFAHGNFEISGSFQTGKLNYILLPRRKDFVVDKPIIISKEALLNANREKIGQLVERFLNITPKQVNEILDKDFDHTLKTFLLPVEMIKMAEHYFYGSPKDLTKRVPKPGRYFSTDYALLVAKITYEQDDYYNIFGKDSDIFKKVAHIRNAIAHDNFIFMENASQICHRDRNDKFIESMSKSVYLLIVLSSQKDLIMRMREKRNDKDYNAGLVDVFKEFYEITFNQGMFEYIQEHGLD